MTRARPDLLLAVLAGGCLGGLLRYGVTSTWPERGFPWAVLVVNLVGSLVLGLLLAATGPDRQRLQALLGTGFCGALTTFSAVTVSTDHLLADGRYAVALVYLGASAVGGVAAAWLGRRLC